MDGPWVKFLSGNQAASPQNIDVAHYGWSMLVGMIFYINLTAVLWVDNWMIISSPQTPPSSDTYNIGLNCLLNFQCFFRQNSPNFKITPSRNQFKGFFVLSILLCLSFLHFVKNTKGNLIFCLQIWSKCVNENVQVWLWLYLNLMFLYDSFVNFYFAVD